MSKTSQGFVETANVVRFRDGIKALEGRAAPESAFAVVTGEWGLGKTRLGLQYALKNDWPFVRLHPACTPHWVLADLMRELGDEPKRTSEQIHGQIIAELLRRPRGLIFDEVEHAVGNGAVIETIRAIVDAVELPCVLMGRKFIARRLKRFPAVWSRVSVVVSFQRLDAADMRLLLAERGKVEVDDALMEELLRQTEGRVRLAVGAAQRLARIAARPNAPAVLGLDQVKGVDLVKEAQVRREAEATRPAHPAEAA